MFTRGSQELWGSGFRNISGGEFGKQVRRCFFPSGRLKLADSGSCEHHTGVHSMLGFVTPNGSSPHLHAANGLFSEVVGPGNFRILIE